MKYYNVGRIINTHGIKGEVKVESLTDFPQKRFKKGQVLYRLAGADRQKMILDGARTQMRFFLLHFKGYDSINDVQAWKRNLLQISADESAKTSLKPGEYYVHQIVGLKVVNEQQKPLGTIMNVIKTGANDVWVVKCPNGKELLLPKIPPVIKKVDLKHHLVTVHLMKGLDAE